MNAFFRYSRLVIVATGFGMATLANATVWDLNADWSDVNNSNGAWSYREGTNLLPSRTFGVADGWATSQTAWGRSGANNYIPAVLKSNGTENFTHDWLAGDVVMHSTDTTNGVGNGPGNMLWTSPVSGLASITGDVWMGREISRSVDWSIWDNGTKITGGTVASGDPYSRSSPFLLSAGSGGAAAITNISIATGDTLRLQLDTTPDTPYGDFVGMNFTITTSSVPEPTSVLAISAGLGALLVRRRRKS
jgi:hypothetical protein